MYLALRQLLQVARDAEHAMCDSLNLDLSVGNDEIDDVKKLSETLEKLALAIEFADRVLKSCGRQDDQN